MPRLVIPFSFLALAAWPLGANRPVQPLASRPESRLATSAVSSAQSSAQSSVQSSALSPALSSAAASAPTVVILVRHAEKAAEPAGDPPLTPVGVERAQALVALLADAKVGAVMHTPTTRTRETARPVAERFGLTPEIIPTGPLPVQSAAVVEMVRRHTGRTIVVVGHSNTVMAWMEALGGPARPALRDDQYDGLYTLILDGASARLVEGRYGPPNPRAGAAMP